MSTLTDDIRNFINAHIQRYGHTTESKALIQLLDSSQFDNLEDKSCVSLNKDVNRGDQVFRSDIESFITPLRVKKIVRFKGGDFYGGIYEGLLDKVSRSDASRFDSEAEALTYFTSELDWAAEQIEKLSPLEIITIIEE